jgi:hypothetical protein
MGRENDRRIIIALLGCIGLLLATILMIATLVGGLVVVAVRASGQPANTTATALAARNSRPIAPFVPATATPPPLQRQLPDLSPHESAPVRRLLLLQGQRPARHR